MSKDTIISEFKRARDEHRQGFYTWQYQKEKLLELSFEIYMENDDMSADEAIGEAYYFLQTFHRDVISKQTKIYFKDNKEG